MKRGLCPPPRSDRALCLSLRGVKRTLKKAAKIL
jgi:hypothetical protein